MCRYDQSIIGGLNSYYKWRRLKLDTLAKNFVSPNGQCVLFCVVCFLLFRFVPVFALLCFLVCLLGVVVCLLGVVVCLRCNVVCFAVA